MVLKGGSGSHSSKGCSPSHALRRSLPTVFNLYLRYRCHLPLCMCNASSFFPVKQCFPSAIPIFVLVLPLSCTRLNPELTYTLNTSIEAGSCQRSFAGVMVGVASRGDNIVHTTCMSRLTCIPYSTIALTLTTRHVQKCA